MSENMVFCLGDGILEPKGEGYQKNYRVFNVQLEKDEWEKIKNSLPLIDLPVAKWIDADKMTKEEKKDKPIYSEIGGYLKVLSYEYAWKEWWSEVSQADKNKILDCKYFDAAIFKSITGLDISKSASLSGKKVSVEIDGKKWSATID
jgi:hypothetical protein